MVEGWRIPLLFFKSLFGLQTQAGWIPVTSTGMRELGGVPRNSKESFEALV
jgi:hypothetical protein